MNEYEFEPVRGLPELLPAGESLLWRGEPDWRSLARRVFHVRKVAFYFGLLLTVSVLARIYAGAPAADIAATASWQISLAVTALAILYFLAWLYARTTVYTLTSDRLVLRFGVALPMMINIPWSKIVGVDLCEHGDGSGDIVFTVDPQRRLSYLMLWPQVRPWRFSPVMPAVRCIPDAGAVALRLGELLRERFADSADRGPQRTAPEARPTVDIGARTATAG